MSHEGYISTWSPQPYCRELNLYFLAWLSIETMLRVAAAGPMNKPGHSLGQRSLSQARLKGLPGSYR